MIIFMHGGQHLLPVGAPHQFLVLHDTISPFPCTFGPPPVRRRYSWRNFFRDRLRYELTVFSVTCNNSAISRSEKSHLSARRMQVRARSDRVLRAASIQSLSITTCSGSTQCSSP